MSNSDFIQNLRTFENTYRNVKRELGEFQDYSNLNSLQDGKIIQSLQGKIVLDPKLDPDPYSLHGMSLAYRLECMGYR